MNKTNTYELAFLALAQLSEEDVAALQSTLSEAVAKVGGQVVSTGDVHYIDLAYEMVKKVGSKNTRHNQAYFSWVKASLLPENVSDLEEVLRSQNSILRHMIISTEADDTLTDVFVPQLDDSDTEVSEETKDDEEIDEVINEIEDTSDDLTKIEGIGPVIATTLVNAGINTFRILSETEESDIDSAIEGVRGNHDAGTWSQQAKLAADGEWDKLQELQDSLNGGR